MTLLEQIGLKALQRLKDHPLRIKKVLLTAPASPIKISSIVLISGTTYQVNFANFDPTSSPGFDKIMIGTVFRIQGGPANGFWLVTGIGVNYVRCECGAAQTYGFVTFYDFDFDSIKAVASAGRGVCETYTGQSFHGELEFNEYRDGNDSVTLVLQKRQIRTITAITPYGWSVPGGAMFTIQTSDIDMSEARTKGILRITPQAAGTGYFTATGSIGRKFFPKAKIQVTGTYGFEEDEVATLAPDAMIAMVYYTCAIMLTEEMSRSDNMISFSQDGYTQANEVGRDIEAFKSLAMSLLTPYCSGEAGS